MASKMNRPGPDRGRSWVIAIACCFINMMFYGMARLAGVLFVASVERFNVSRQQASLPFTLSSCIRNLSGPLVGYLGHRFGVRFVVTSGSFIASFGIAACFFANNINFVTVMWGVVFGIGFGMGNIILPVSINQYFDKHRATASGIAFSGGCLGSFVLPPLVEILMNVYGLSGTFLIMAGLVLNCVPAGLLLRNPDFTIQRQSKKLNNSVMSERQSMVGEKNVRLYTVEDNVSKSADIRIDKPELLNANTETNLSLKNGVIIEGGHIHGSYSTYQDPPSEWMTANPSLTFDERIKRLSTQTLLSDYSIRLSSSEPVDCDFIIRNSKGRRTVTDAHSDCETCSVASHEKVVFDDVFSNGSQPGSRKSSEQNAACDGVTSISGSKHDSNETGPSLKIPYTFTEQCFNTDAVCKLSIHSGNSEFKNMNDKQLNSKEIYCNLAYQSDEDFAQKVNIKSPSNIAAAASKSAGKDKPKSALDSFKVFLDPVFIIILFTYAFYCFTFVAMITVIVDFARDIGIDPSNEKYILMSLSVGDFAGRIGLGWITDRGYMTKTGFVALAFMSQAVSTVVVAFCSGFTMLMAIIAWYGLSEAGIIVVVPLIIAQYIEEDRQTVAIPSSTFLSGPFCLVVAPLIGIFREGIGSYDGIFYLVGITSLLCGLIILLLPRVASCRKR